MLWFLLTASVVDVAGMEPQITELRALAASHQLQIICEGREGEAKVLRLQFPANMDRTGEERLRAELNLLASDTQAVRLETASGKCDHEAPKVRSTWPASVEPKLRAAGNDLIFGPREFLEPLAERAVACGISHAHVRPPNDIDLQFLALAKNPPTIRPGWLVLDAGEDTDRYHPITCWMVYARRQLEGEKTQAH